MPDTDPAGIAMPESLTDIDDKALEKLKGSIEKRFNVLNAKEKVSPEDLAEMAVLADQMDAIRAESKGREAAQQEAAQQRAELATRMAEGDGGEGDGGEDDEDDQNAPVVPIEAPPVVDPTAPSEGDGDDENKVPEGLGQPTVADALAASAKPPAVAKKGAVTPRQVDARRTAMPEKYGDGVTITASSDIPGFTTGSALKRDDLSRAMHARARGMGDGAGRGNAALVASISLAENKWDVSKLSDDEKIRQIWNERHNPQSLVASGGWCAPSETIYDFVCDFEAVDGLVDIPTITSTRGGLRYPVSPLLSDVFADADAGFTWTEADDIAAAEPGGPTKPCFVIPCPDFDEVRLQAQGICVTSGNLTDRAYPELTNRYIDLVLAAHAHRMNGLTIAKMVAASTNHDPTFDVGLSASMALLGGAEFEIARLRDVYFMGEDQMLEVILPRWARSVIRQDLARRNGVPLEMISNAAIDAHFREVGAMVQFVMDWQKLVTGAVAYPTTVEMLVYPPGAHTRLDGGSIDLGVVRDSVLNSTNDFTAAWTEEFWQVLTRCASIVTTVPVCPTGATGGTVDIECATTPTV